MQFKCRWNKESFDSDHRLFGHCDGVYIYPSSTHKQELISWPLRIVGAAGWHRGYDHSAGKMSHLFLLSLNIPLHMAGKSALFVTYLPYLSLGGTSEDIVTPLTMTELPQSDFSQLLSYLSRRFYWAGVKDKV